VKRVLIIIAIALVGAALCAYPAVSNYIFARNCSTATREYDGSIAKLDAEILEQAWREAVIYNENLEGNPVHDPFLKGSGMVMADNYYEVLDLNGDGVMGYVSIPKIAVKIPVCHGTAEATLLKGIGHLEGSSMPIGGAGAHSVLTGHTGLVNAKMFTDLVKLSEGDEFYLQILDRTLAYRIDQIKVVLPENTADLQREPGADYCTLVTCTPYGINSHRLLVRGERIDYTPEKALTSPGAVILERFKDWDMLIGLAVGIALIVLIVLFVVFRRKKQEKEARTASMERSINPWAINTTPMQTPGGRKGSRSSPRKRPRRRRRGAKFWWEEDRG
jgi:sortase A